MNDNIILMGAEKQSAVSIALAYKEINFLFVSTEPIIDGWDLPNVSILSYKGYINNYKEYSNNKLIILNSRYNLLHQKEGIKIEESYNLFDTFSALTKHFSDFTLPVNRDISKLRENKELIIKGNYFHKQDAVEIIKSDFPVYSDDVYGCGYVFQQYLVPSKRFMVIGKRNEKGGILIALFIILRESNAREDLILAGETIFSKDIIDKSIQIIEYLNYKGLFALNWIENKNNPYLTSFRAEPKAVFQTLRNADYDLLNYTGTDTTIVKQGLKFIADIKYSSYKITS